MVPIRIVIATALLTAAAVPAAAPAQTARDSVLSTVQGFFDALGSRDSVASRRVMTADGEYYAVRTNDGRVSVTKRTNSEHFATIGTRLDVLLERMWNPTVLIRGPVAQVWTEYDFHVNGRFSHCGVDSVGLIRTADGWKIASIIYTVEPTGCAPSPLGPPGR